MEGARKVLEGVKEEDINDIAAGLTSLDEEVEDLDVESGFALALAHEYFEEEDYNGLKQYTEEILVEQCNPDPLYLGALGVINGSLVSFGHYRYSPDSFSDVLSSEPVSLGLLLTGYYGTVFGTPLFYSRAKSFDYEKDVLDSLSNESKENFTDVSEEAQRRLLEDYNVDTYGELSKTEH